MVCEVGIESFSIKESRYIDVVAVEPRYKMLIRNKILWNLYKHYSTRKYISSETGAKSDRTLNFEK